MPFNNHNNTLYFNEGTIIDTKYLRLSNNIVIDTFTTWNNIEEFQLQIQSDIYWKQIEIKITNHNLKENLRIYLLESKEVVSDLHYLPFIIRKIIDQGYK